MPVNKWKNTFYATIYELVRGGHSMKDVAAALDVSSETLKRWHKDDPDLRDTVERAKALKESNRSGPGRFQRYCYDRLPDNLKGLWDQLTAADRTNNPERTIELLLENEGLRTRQMLAIHALVKSRWSVAQAMRRIGEPRETWDTWVTTDPDFQELVISLKELKKDYLESAFYGLVDAGDTAAILFGMRTLNADRGYNPKVTVQHKHEGNVLHAHVDVAKLPMDIETKAKVLEAIRAARDTGETKVLNPGVAPELLIDDED